MIICVIVVNKISPEKKNELIKKYLY